MIKIISKRINNDILNFQKKINSLQKDFNCVINETKRKSFDTKLFDVYNINIKLFDRIINLDIFFDINFPCYPFIILCNNEIKYKTENIDLNGIIYLEELNNWSPKTQLHKIISNLLCHLLVDDQYKTIGKVLDSPYLLDYQKCLNLFDK